MAGSMTSMVGGLFAVSYLRGATMKIIDHGDAIDKMAKRMEASTDTAQRFDLLLVKMAHQLEILRKRLPGQPQAWREQNKVCRLK